ncbi:MAG: glycosyltransferase [Methanomassiliicoccales archaeon]
MRIAFILSSFPKLSHKFILNQITGLIDMGHQLDIYSIYSPGERVVHDGVRDYALLDRVRYFGWKGRGIGPSVLSILRLLLDMPKACLFAIASSLLQGRNPLNCTNLIASMRDREYDVIHSHFGPLGLISIKAKLFGLRGAHITSFHGYDANVYPRIRGADVYRELFGKGDRFTANTRFTMGLMKELGAGDNIDILPVGLDLEEFPYFERRGEERVKLLTVGRLVEKKGHRYAIEAAQLIKEQGGEFTYQIVGDGPLRGELEALVEKLDLTDEVIFRGSVGDQELTDLFGESDIFVLPSVKGSDGDMEGQGLVIQEAQATGLPVVSTLHNGIPEGVIDGETAYLVPEKDPEALADRIAQLMENPGRRLEMGARGRSFVERNYSIADLNRRLIDIYGKAIEAMRG